jgi:hypothetical protein
MTFGGKSWSGRRAHSGWGPCATRVSRGSYRQNTNSLKETFRQQSWHVSPKSRSIISKTSRGSPLASAAAAHAPSLIHVRSTPESGRRGRHVGRPLWVVRSGLPPHSAASRLWAHNRTCSAQLAVCDTIRRLAGNPREGTIRDTHDPLL